MDLGKESYKIEIERGLLPHIGEKIRKLTKAQKIAVITDNHVQAIYGDKIRESCSRAISTCASLKCRPARRIRISTS